MHLNTGNSDKLLLQHPSVGTNSYGHSAFSNTAPTVWNKLQYEICNAPLLIDFRKEIKNTLF